MITSPSSCLSIKERSVNAAISSLSLFSADDSKMISNNGSILDPSAPIFIPRQSRQKLDDENETVENLNLIKYLFSLLIYFSHLHHLIRILMIFIILINFSKNFIIQIMNMIII
jgi:hypothetical protein